MLIDNLTAVANNASLTRYLHVFDQILGGYFLFGILLGFLVVFTVSLWAWSRDVIQSLTFSSFLITTTTFLLFLIKIDGQRLISFEKFSFFMVITGLALFAKKMQD